MQIGEFACFPYNPGDMTCYRVVVGMINQFNLLFGFGINTDRGCFYTFDIVSGTPSLGYVNEKLFGSGDIRGGKYTKALALHVLCYLLGTLPYAHDRDEHMIHMIVATHEQLPKPFCDEGMSEWHSVGLPKSVTA